MHHSNAGVGTGDPHYRAISVHGHRAGGGFDFQSVGDYLLLEIGPENSQLQGRMDRWTFNPFTVHESFAFGEPGSFAYQVLCVFRRLTSSAGPVLLRLVKGVFSGNL